MTKALAIVETETSVIVTEDNKVTVLDKTADIVEEIKGITGVEESLGLLWTMRERHSMIDNYRDAVEYISLQADISKFFKQRIDLTVDELTFFMDIDPEKPTGLILIEAYNKIREPKSLTKFITKAHTKYRTNRLDKVLDKVRVLRDINSLNFYLECTNYLKEELAK